MALRLEFGADVRCNGVVVGELSDLVVDPGSRRVTHIVVGEPEARARLVPLVLAARDADNGKAIALTCTAAELDQFEQIRNFAYGPLEYVPQPDGEIDIGIEDGQFIPQFA